jgi:8-amino-7-oxononanoate synthase
MRHGSASLHPWSQLTTGKPAALEEPALAPDVADRLAQLIGCERALLLPSTLHAFVDLFGMLSQTRSAVYVDAGTYPIARWGIERITGRGVRVRFFPRHDADTLQRLLRCDARSHVRSIVVTDGVCPECGRPAPITDYLAALDEHGGCLVMDDTQSLGIFGNDPTSEMPYGRGGGGTLRWHGLRDARVWVVSSLAKAFGVPVAVLAGNRNWVEAFERRSQTRVHCSPPCAAVLHAAARALAINARHGDALRRRLLSRVQRFRARLAEIGLSAGGDVFPVQTLGALPSFDMPALHHALLQRGIHTVLHKSRGGNTPRLSFVLTVNHRDEDIDDAIDHLADVVWRNPARTFRTRR